MTDINIDIFISIIFIVVKLKLTWCRIPFNYCSMGNHFFNILQIMITW